MVHLSLFFPDILLGHLFDYTNLLSHSIKQKVSKNLTQEKRHFFQKLVNSDHQNLLNFLIINHNNLMTTAEEELQAVEITLRKTA